MSHLLLIVLDVVDARHVSPNTSMPAKFRHLLDCALQLLDLVPLPSSPERGAQVPEDLALRPLWQECRKSDDREETWICVEGVGRAGMGRSGTRSESYAVSHVL